MSPVLPRAWCRPLPIVAACAVAAAGEPGASAAGGGPGRGEADPEGARRIVQVFDFEEQDAPQPWPHEVPRHWLRAQDSESRPRPGFPAYNLARFDRTVAASGQASLIVPTRGGSTSVHLAPGVIPVFPQGDYLIRGHVRTDGLAHARAFVTARFLDQRLATIPGAEARTEPIDTGGAWGSFSVELAGLFDDAAFLQIDLELLQPREFGAGSPLGPHAVWPEDFAGAAWFDDVGIFQLPRVELTTASPANIVVAPDRPVLHPLVRDLVGESLDARLTVRDVDDRVVAQTSFPVSSEPGAAGGGQPWEPGLPGFGWYRATLDVFAAQRRGGRRIGRAEVAFLFMPGSSPPISLEAERDRFGLIADRAHRAELAALPTVARETGGGFVVLPAWDDEVTRETVADSLAAREAVVDELLEMRRSVTFALPSVPEEVASLLRLDRDDPLSLAAVDPASWLGYLTPVLDRYGQRITRWQIGRIGDDRAYWGEGAGGISDSVWRFHDLLAGLVPGPSVALPWWADRRLPSIAAPEAQPAGSARAAIAVGLSYPESFAASSMGPMAAQWRREASPREGSGRAPLSLTLVPQLPPEDLYGARARVIELARRSVEFWAAMGATPPGAPPARLAIDHPWRWTADRRPQLEPAPELGAWRTLVERLAGRRIVGEYPAMPGVRCFIVAPAESESEASNGRTGATEAGGGLIAWNESAPPDRAAIHGYLGKSRISITDVFGNQSSAARNSDASGTHTIPLTETPIFIEGVDHYLARFVASVHLEPAFAPAVAAPHEHTVVIANPWPVPISGRLRVLPPDADRAGAGGVTGWTIAPGSMAFSLDPGRTRAVAFTLTFPPGEESGFKDLTAVVQLDTDQGYPPLEARTALELGMKDFEMTADCRLSPGPEGPDVIVTAVITNRGQVHRTLRLDATALATPAQQVPISDLAPGQSVLKRIVLPGAAARLTGKRVRLSLGDADAPERLNKSVRVP